MSFKAFLNNYYMLKTNFVDTKKKFLTLTGKYSSNENSHSVCLTSSEQDKIYISIV